MASKAVHLVRHLAKAAQPKQPQTKREILEQLRRIKAMTAFPQISKEHIQSEISRLESKLSGVMSMEQELSKKESSDVSSLQKQLRDLRLKLSVTDSGELQRRLDRILFLLSELSARFETYTSIKVDREQKVKEIERKIKESVSQDLEEISEVEERVADLEERYRILKQKKKKVDKKQLQMLANKISFLRQKLADKRIEIAEKRKEDMARSFAGLPSRMQQRPQQPQKPQQFEEERYTTKPIPRPRLVFPQQIQKPLHKIMFPEAQPVQDPESQQFPLYREEKPLAERFPPLPQPRFGAEFEQQQLAELPPLPALPLKKESILEKIFGSLGRK